MMKEDVCSDVDGL